ncbi:MAG: Uma2 family endonuclease [Rhodocyclaceae bacterium]|nr:Uma2 family endonuclease [Rhodocyclaceae bacterium]
MGTAQLAYLTVADYLAGEDLPGSRHEYVNGEIFAMAGASKAHGTLALNLALALRSHLRGKPCRTWASDMKVQVLAANSYYYPDVVVTCAADELGADSPQNFVSAPTIVIEVLSPSTEKVDRREKWFAYRQLSSLQEYVLVDQERQWVEVFRRHEGGWMQDIAAAGESITLPSIGLTLALNDIYEDSGVPEFSVAAAL